MEVNLFRWKKPAKNRVGTWFKPGEGRGRSASRPGCRHQQGWRRFGVHGGTAEASRGKDHLKGDRAHKRSASFLHSRPWRWGRPGIRPEKTDKTRRRT